MKGASVGLPKNSDEMPAAPSVTASNRLSVRAATALISQFGGAPCVLPARMYVLGDEVLLLDSSGGGAHAKAKSVTALMRKSGLMLTPSFLTSLVESKPRRTRRVPKT